MVMSGIWVSRAAIVRHPFELYTDLVKVSLTMSSRHIVEGYPERVFEKDGLSDAP